MAQIVPKNDTIFDQTAVGQQQESARKDGKKSEKQRQLESIYKVARGNSRSNYSVRQALAANLKRNSKIGSERIMRRNVFGGT